MSFFNPNALRMLLEHETQANAPVNEETTSQVRENIEALLMLMAYTGTSGSLTSDPPNNTTGQVSDNTHSFGPNEHDGRSLVVTSGAAKGNIYPITLTLNFTMGSHDLESAGNNLYADGLRSGDTYMIFYSLDAPEAHTHNGVNSAGIEAPRSLAGYYIEALETARGDAATGKTGPSGYTYERKIAIKLGRGGYYKVNLSCTAGSSTSGKRGILAINGAPAAAAIDFQGFDGTTYDLQTVDLSFETGDLLELYIDTGTYFENDAWKLTVMTDNPAYDPKPLLESEL